ncbi:MAG: glycosyltransferase family 4 protein [Pirellulales bacterium]|nr:glycosyltransferase family 4 protein [Pirellulales bacterium]
MTLRLLHVMRADSPGAIAQVDWIAQFSGANTSSIIHVTDRTRVGGMPPRDSSRTCLRLRGLFDVSGIRQLRARVTQAKPDLVHIWDPQFLPPSALLALALGRRWPLVASFRHPVNKRSGSHFLLRWLSRRICRFAADSEFVKASCVASGWGTTDMQVIPGGCESKTSVNGVVRQKSLQPIKLDDEARLIVAIGSLSSHKRLSDLIWAADMLAPVEPRLHLAIVGEGPAQAQLEETRHSVRRGHRISILSPAAMPWLLDRAEFAVLPGAVDGCCHAALQAMAAGLPLVAARGGGNGALLGEGEAGLSFPVGDRGELARTLWGMLAKPDRQRAFGHAARRRATELFPAEEMASAYADLYRELS